LAQAIAALVEVAEHEAVLAVRRNDAVDTLREILLSTPSVPPVAVRAEAGSEANADGDARDHPHALSTPMGSPPRRAGAGDEG
ncbi:MAG: hypothetical protein RMJ84_13940, partial [Sandaracinaceae bacterium]|nr:hypothetical protein [Sandaracinaceae bacterium]